MVKGSVISYTAFRIFFLLPIIKGRIIDAINIISPMLLCLLLIYVILNNIRIKWEMRIWLYYAASVFFTNIIYLALSTTIPYSGNESFYSYMNCAYAFILLLTGIYIILITSDFKK